MMIAAGVVSRRRLPFDANREMRVGEKVLAEDETIMSTTPTLRMVNPPPSHHTALPEEKTTTFGFHLALIINIAKEIRTAVDGLIEKREWQGEKGLDFYKEVEKFEIELIMQALNNTGGNQRQAAKLLNVKVTTLNSKIKRYRLVARTSFYESEAKCPTNTIREVTGCRGIEDGTRPTQAG